jgi:hypothetical protein
MDLRRHVVAAATERLPYKAAALFLALVLWLVVSAEEQTEDLVPVRLALMLDSSLTLEGQRPTVRALVVGRGRELLKLYANPPVVRRALPADSPDSVQFELRPVDVDLPSEVDARVRDVQPRTIALHFAPNAERRVPVASALTLVPGPGVRVVGPPRFAPDSVTVVGPRRRMAEVTSVVTVRERIVVADTLPITVALDTARVPGQVRPSRVRVDVPVQIDAAAVAAADSARKADSARQADSARAAGAAGRSPRPGASP